MTWNSDKNRGHWDEVEDFYKYNDYQLTNNKMTSKRKSLVYSIIALGVVLLVVFLLS